jgi:hypothetical protein
VLAAAVETSRWVALLPSAEALLILSWPVMAVGPD